MLGATVETRMVRYKERCNIAGDEGQTSLFPRSLLGQKKQENAVGQIREPRSQAV